jgi:hypothetical protein
VIWRASSVNENQRIGTGCSRGRWRRSKPPHPILVPLPGPPGPCAGRLLATVYLVVRAALQRLCLASQSPGPCPDLHCSLGVAVEAKARHPQIQPGHLGLLSSSSPFSLPRRPISLALQAPGTGRRSFSLDISWEAAPRPPRPPRPRPPRPLTAIPTRQLTTCVLHVRLAHRRPPALSTPPPPPASILDWN